MRWTSIAGVVLAARVAGALEPDAVGWDRSNVDRLQVSGRSAIERFINRLRVDDLRVAVGDFAWRDLGGDGHYQLVTTEDLSGRAFFDYIAVYRRDARGRVRFQVIEGVAVDLARAIRDLDGDGKQELVVPSALGDGDPRGGGDAPWRVWPKVYRLRDGAYVDASRDYAAFYYGEVLPELDRAIEHARFESARGDVPPGLRAWHEHTVAVIEGTKREIERMVGRPARTP